MDFYENTVEELYKYLPELTKKEDFDQFWQDTINQAKSVPLEPEMEVYDYPSDYIKAYSISYNGFDDTRIHGLYLIPTFLKKDKYPCLINYHGYTGGRGIPSDFMVWLNMGLAVLSVDCRDQGGITGNNAKYSSGWNGDVACKGILDKNEYYFRAVYMDCLKAIDFAQTCSKIDMNKLIINGHSQGGALAMAVCSLDHRPKMVMADCPSNSNIEKRIEGANGSFGSITNFLKRYPYQLGKSYETLSYFDTMNMVDKIQCQVFASVALRDEVCPALCYFASYNRIKAPKQINVYPFNGHDGAYPIQIEKKLHFLKESGLLED